MSLRSKFYICASCDFASSCLEKLNFHRQKCVNVKCPFCEKFFHGQTHFFLHLNHAHMKLTDSFMCPLCALNCKTKFNFQRHFLGKHVEFDKIHKCEKCNKAFHRKDNCKVHQSKCLKLKPIKPIFCGKCNKKFFEISEFDSHKKLCISQYNKKNKLSSNSITKRTDILERKGNRKRKLMEPSSSSNQSKVRKIMSTNSEQVPSTLQFRYGKNDTLSVTCRQCQLRFPSRELFYRHWMKVRKTRYL